MKSIQLLLSILFLATSAIAGDLITKPDFLIKNKSDLVIKRGIYTTGANGEVLRYDILSEETKKILHTEIPVYDNKGEIALTKIYDGNGKIKMIVVKVGATSVKLDGEGKVLTEAEFQKLYDSEYKQ